MGNKRNNAEENKPSSEVELDSKVRRVRRSANSLGKDTLYFSIYLGLLILLGVVVALAITREPPVPSSPDEINAWLRSHIAVTNFRLIKTVVRPLFKEPVEKWSAMYRDPNTGCVELGNNIWCAAGMADLRSANGETVRQSWIIYFDAGSLKPLYAKVGDNESGHLSQALSLAHAKPASGETAH